MAALWTITLLAATVLAQPCARTGDRCGLRAGGRPFSNPFGPFYPAVTNSVLQSQNVASGWSAENHLSSNPTVTADTSLAPACADVYNIRGCGLVTADRLQVPALADGRVSQIYQSNGCPAGQHSGGVYLKGTSGSGTLRMYTGQLCVACPFTASAWTRCEANGGTSSNGKFSLGNIASVGGACSGAMDAVDVQFWQADCQDTPRLTPPILTEAAAVTRPPGYVRGATKLLAGMGDSITASTGTGLVPAPVGVAYLLGPEYAWIQGGVPGDTCADVLARWAAVAAQSPTHVFVMCGVNDARTGRTAAAAWADLEDILEDARARRMKVRPVLTLNFDGAADSTPTGVAMINTLRASISAWCSANGVQCVNPATDLQTGDALKAEYSDDGIHLNAAGQAIFRQHIAQDWN